MLSADVAVVGGGPAGAAAAIELARGGRHVVVLDRARFPRDKCCGDGLTTGALRRLDDLGFEPGTVASWQPVDACWVRSPSGRTAAFPFAGHGTYGAVAPRVELDHALLDLARRSGVTVLEGHGVTGAAASADGVTLAVDGAPAVAARYAIGADGTWSPLRKALLPAAASARPYLGEWHAMRQYFRDTGPMARRLWVWFEPDLLPGYAWSFPLPDGRANVGFGIHRASWPGNAHTMAEVWRNLVRRPHIAEVLGERAVAEASHRAWPIPTALPRSTTDAAGGRALFVGDAARACDPMTGEGIGQALETASLAARAILAAGPRRADHAARRYREALRQGMVVDHHVAALLSRALAHRKGARGAVRIAGAGDWTRRNFARWLFEDYPRAALVTPQRWHRDMLAGPGAFTR